MFEKIRDILAEQLFVQPETIRPDSRIKEDLGADSLDILQLLMTLEETSGAVIPDEELATFQKVSDIMDYLESRGIQL
ncbi:MAG: acyl carrier protein [Clostridia bacterium]|nr:acyl carrier protein [Clostridia bacterium]